MKNIKTIIGSIVVVALILTAQPVIAAEVSKSDFVDLSFTANNRIYYSNNISKVLNTVPYLDGNTLMVPYDALLNELGYSYSYNTMNSSISASRGSYKLVMNLNDRFAIVNGAKMDMGVTPKKQSGGKTVFVSAVFIAKISGAEQSWDASTKTLNISRVGSYDVGKVMFYEKKKGENKVYVYDGKTMNEIDLGKKEIVNWYTYKGQILVTIFDSETNKNNFAIYKNNDFSILIDDFDIKDTFEYNNNLLIHGFDRSQKFNKLYRFDGKALILVQDNFYVGEHILFKDKLVINKYDNNRNYTLVVFDKNSWIPGILSNGFVIKDSIEYEGILYMSGLWQEGVKKPLAAYDGNTITSDGFKLLNQDINVDVNMIAVHNNMLYAVVDNCLLTIEKDRVEYILFTFKGDTIRYVVTDIKEFKGNLYISTTGAKKPTQLGSWVPIFDDDLPASVLEYNSINDYKKLIDSYKASELRIDNDVLFILGNTKTRTSTYNDPSLYAYNSSVLVKTQDVLKIEDVIAVGDNTFINVKDRDRMSGKVRDTVIFLSNMEFKNLVVDMDTKKWDNVNDSLILAGYEADIKRNKLYSYSNNFNELEGNFEIKYWDKIFDTLFVNGFNQETYKYSLCKFEDKTPVKIRDGIEVLNMIKASKDYYIVYGVERSLTSQYNNKKILYIYDDAKKQFIEMKVGIEIADMIFVQ